MAQNVGKIVVFLMLIMALPGCSFYRVDSQDTTLDFYPAKASFSDVAYLEKIDKPYEVVGIVAVSVENGQPLADVLGQMRGQAALLGGDAITAVEVEPEGAMRKRYKSKVVVFK